MKQMQLTVLIVTAGLISSAFNAEAQFLPFLTNGLVSYYAFNGNSEDSFGTNNGTPYGITYVPDRFGNPNAAASFAGNSSSYIDVLSTNLDLNPPFSVSVWISYGTFGIGGPRVFSTSGYEMSFYYGMGQQSTDPIGINGMGPSLLSANTLQVGVWTHVVGVWTTNCKSIYINGVYSGSTNSTLPIDFSRWPYARIGGNSGSTTQDNYGGLIDDLAIYSRALSAQEVSELYESFVSGIVTLPTVTIAGTTNQTYSIQYVNNLSNTNWITLVSNIVLQGSSPYYYPDTNAIGQPQRFYRVVAQ